MLTQTSTQKARIEKSRSLLQQGYIAYNNWEIRKARLLWRKAATYDPSNSEIWGALLQVIQNDDDRKVCLQNILILNPDDAEAEQRLRLLEHETQPTDAQPIDLALEPSPPMLTEGMKQIISWILSGIIMVVVVIILVSMVVQIFV